MYPEGQRVFQPNRLILEAAHRAAVDCFGSLADLRLSLRPARKCLFREPPTVRSLQVELRKPAFAALIDRNDPEAKVRLAIETEPISPGIRALYRAEAIPVVTVKCRLGACQFICERDGFYADLRPAEHLVDRTVQFLTECTEGEADLGRLVCSPVERVIASCLAKVSSELNLSVHYKVPFGYAVGYRPDLPGAAARQTVEFMLAYDPKQFPFGEVVLPIRVESRPPEQRDEDTKALDEAIADFVVQSGIPMVAVERVGASQYAVTCSMDGIGEQTIGEEDAQGWVDYFDAACARAADMVHRALQGTIDQHSG